MGWILSLFTSCGLWSKLCSLAVLVIKVCFHLILPQLTLATILQSRVLMDLALSQSPVQGIASPCDDPTWNTSCHPRYPVSPRSAFLCKSLFSAQPSICLVDFSICVASSNTSVCRQCWSWALVLRRHRLLGGRSPEDGTGFSGVLLLSQASSDKELADFRFMLAVYSSDLRKDLFVCLTRLKAPFLLSSPQLLRPLSWVLTLKFSAPGMVSFFQ